MTPTWSTWLLAVSPQGGSGPSGSAQTMTIILWSGALILAVVVGGVVIKLVRANMLGRGGSWTDSGSALEQMRKLREQGKMSDEEFDAARSSLGARLRGTAPPARAAMPRPPVPIDKGTEDVRVARPGFDLTGAPLPRPPKRPGESGASASGA